MKRLAIGVIIILAGILLLFVNLGILPWSLKHIIFTWQTLIVVIGFSLLFDRNQNNKMAGVVLMVVGFAFMIPRIFPALYHVNLFWPIALVCSGIAFVVFSFKKNREGYKETDASRGVTNIGSIPFSDSRFTDSKGFQHRDYIFSGTKEVVSSDDFYGIEINAVFSGVEVDLSQCQLSESQKYIHVKAASVFSGITLYIPLEWNLEIRKSSVLGDFVDRRPYDSPVEVDKSKTVILELTSVFGGGDIKYYE